MTSLGGRWAWPAMLGVMVVGTGYASGWQLLQRAGFGLLALLVLCLVATLAGALALSAEGTPRARAVTAGDTLTISYTLRNRGFWPLAWTLLQPQGFSVLPVEGQLVALP